MESSTSRPVHVLHVDDDESILELSAQFLERERESFRVTTTTDVAEALDLVESATVDCVVSDYQMPAMDGLTFLDAVRERRSRLPFVLFTGKGSEEIASEAITAGVTDYHHKGGGVEQWTVLANKIAIAVEHYRAEEALRESESRYRTVVERSHDGIYIYRDGTLQFVNDRACEITGYSEAELLGMPLDDLLHESDRDRVIEMARRRRAGEDVPTTYRTRIVRKDGDVSYVELSVKPISYEGERAVLGSARDVTEQVEQRRELQRERDRISALFENIAVPVVYYEFEGEDPLVRDANPAFEETFGFESHEVVGESVDDVIVPPEHVEQARSFNRRLHAGERIETDATRLTADGAREFHIMSVPLTPGERSDRGYAVYTDITDRKRHERRLNAIHEVSRELMRANTATEIAETVSEAAAETLDYPVNTVLLYREPGKLVPEATTEAARDLVGETPTFEEGEGLVWEAFERGDAMKFDDVRDAKHVYNPETPIRSEFFVPLGDRGVFIAASTDVGHFDSRDVTLVNVLAANAEAALERVDREVELREQRATLERQNERLDEFASVVSHDLRNPLNVILGRLSLVRDQTDSAHLDTIEESARHMERLIDDVLALARDGETVGETESVDLEAAAISAWQQVEADGASLTVDETVPTVEADERRLQDLLANLFRNAVEHGSTSPPSQAQDDSVEHGSTGSRTGSDDAVEHGSTSPPSQARDGSVRVRVGSFPDGFYVADDGPGIHPDERRTVFERGYSGSDRGTGFGLYIVATIVDAHGWAIDVTESDAGGAKFEITTDP